jgi:RNA polymerase sigma factor for flagellar operon FliA
MTPAAPWERSERERRAELEALFLASLPLVDAVVARVVRERRMSRAERQDFRSEVHLALIQNDYRVLDRFQGASSLQTYLAVVVKRLYIDHRRRQWGKWRPSAAARQLGPAALALESLLHRDRRPPSEAIQIVSGAAAMSHDELAALVARLPLRFSRRPADERGLRNVPAGDAACPDTSLENEALCARVQDELSRIVEGLSEEDRAVLCLHFSDGLSIAAIARARALDQKGLYRRVQRVLKRAERALRRRGVEWPAVRRMIDGGRCHIGLTDV